MSIQHWIWTPRLLSGVPRRVERHGPADVFVPVTLVPGAPENADVDTGIGPGSGARNWPGKRWTARGEELTPIDDAFTAKCRAAEAARIEALFRPAGGV